MADSGDIQLTIDSSQLDSFIKKYGGQGLTIKVKGDVNTSTIDKSFKQAGTQSGKTFEQTFTKETSKIGDEIPKKIRNQKGQFEKVGRDTGDEFSKGFEKEATARTSKISGDMKNAFVGAFAGFTAAGAVDKGISLVTEGFTKALEVAQGFNSGLAELQAVTGVSGKGLDELGNSARELAKKFGSEVNEQLTSFSGILSVFGPDLAKTPAALTSMTDTLNTLAKAGLMSADEAMQALNGTMLQFGIDAKEPAKAAEEYARIANIMSASAAVGSASIQDVSASMAISGGSAHLAGLSIEETAAAIQTLALAELKGSEAGTGLRNVLGLLQKNSGEADKALAKIGLSTKQLGQSLNTVGLGETMKLFGESLKTIQDPAERNAILMQVFGTENARAANALLANSEAMKEYQKGLTGTNDAQRQANIIMDSYAERVKRLKSGFDDFLLTVGLLVQKGLLYLMDAMADLWETIKPVVNFIGDVAVGYFKSLWDIIVSLYDIFSALWPVLKYSLLPVLVTLGVSIGLALAPFIAFGKLLQAITPHIKDLAKTISKFLEPIIKGLGETMDGAVGSVLKFFGVASEGSKKTPKFNKDFKDLNEEVDKLGTAILPPAITGLDDLNKGLDDTKKTVPSLQEMIKKLAELTIAQGKTTDTTKLKKLQDGYDKWFKSTKKVFDAEKQLNDEIARQNELLKGAAIPIDNVATKITKIDNSFKGFTKTALNLVPIETKDDLNELEKALQDIGLGAEESLKPEKSIFQSWIDGFKSIIDPITETFDIIKNSENDLAEALREQQNARTDNEIAAANKSVEIAQAQVDKRKAMEVELASFLSSTTDALLSGQALTFGEFVKQYATLIVKMIEMDMLAQQSKSLMAALGHGSTFNFAGVAIALGNIALILAAGAAAKAAVGSIGADKGLVNLDTAYNVKPSSRDTIDAKLRLGESVITPEGTLAKGKYFDNIEALEYANRGLPIENLLLQKMDFPNVNTRTGSVMVYDNRPLIQEIQMLKKEVVTLKNAAIHTAETNAEMVRQKPTVNKLEIKRGWLQ